MTNSCFADAFSRHNLRLYEARTINGTMGIMAPSLEDAVLTAFELCPGHHAMQVKLAPEWNDD